LSPPRTSAVHTTARSGLPAAAKRRIDRLESAGYIRGYTAILDHTKLGRHLEAFAELRFAPGTQVRDIDHALDDLPELVSRSLSPATPTRSSAFASATWTTSNR